MLACTEFVFVFFFMSTLDRFFVFNEKNTFALFGKKENLSNKDKSN